MYAIVVVVIPGVDVGSSPSVAVAPSVECASSASAVVVVGGGTSSGVVEPSKSATV
jgi:hypothetical protein